MLDRNGFPPDQQRALKLWVCLSRAYLRVDYDLHQHLVAHDLTPAQFGIMECLAHLGPQTMGSLGAKVLVSPGCITGLVDRLQKKGRVRRVRDAKDQRIVRIELTRDGERVVRQAFARHRRVVTQRCAALGAAEQDEMIRLAKKLGKARTSGSARPRKEEVRVEETHTRRNVRTRTARVPARSGRAGDVHRR